MKLTRASRYALTTLAYLAREKPDATVASHNIAAAEGIPEKSLLKVLKPLVDVGILRSLKGPHGGYRLARPAKEVTLLEVIEAVDAPIRGATHDVSEWKEAAFDKRLQAVCDEAAALVREGLAKVTLAELAKGK
ncbi:MAG TPA: Rrf2 family transcriptional regulator [Gemmataceae bacterium]|nr:Rrf2 family transcriptional regulator [Gemmataceae bacterium]